MPDQPAELKCAIEHREAGRYNEAALVLQDCLDRNPQDARAYALLAQVLSLDRQDKPAWVALNTALSINPALPIVQRNHARLLLKQQKRERALEAALAAYQSDATDPENQLVLAAALGANGQIEHAFTLIESALQSRPAYAEAFASRAQLKLRCNNFPGALADVEMALSIKPHLGQLWGMVGSLRYQLNDLGGAIDALGKALEYEPNSVSHLVNLGEYNRQAGQLEAAIVFLEKALAIEPNNVYAWVNLGTALQEARRIPEARTAYEKALIIDPLQAEIACNLGVLVKEECRWEEAIQYFNQALTISPGLAEAHYNLGKTLKDMGRLDKAEASYRRALEFKPDFAEVHHNLGNILREMGRLDEAAIGYRHALKVKPHFAEAHINLGITLHDLGRLDEAKASYRQALKYRTYWAAPYFNLHPLLLNPDDMSPAIKCLEYAVEIDSSNAEYRFFLGILLDYSGDSEAAAGHFDCVEKSANLYRAKLDAWRYIQSVNSVLPLITGSNIQAFKLGIDAAVSDGLVMEFGVRFGSTIRQIAALVDQEVHGFDSFEGLPEQWNHEPKGSYSTNGVIPNVPDNVALYAGWFEDTLPAFLNSHVGPVRFMNIDCDIYSSTKTVLDLLADRIIPGTVIVFDEYIGNEHWREDEFKAFQDAVVKYQWNYRYISFSFFTKQVVIQIVRVQ